MGTLPQLIEEDIQLLDGELRTLLKESDATTAAVIDKGGFLITTQGDDRDFDWTTIAALASGAYLANQTIANLVHETNFNSVYQQGERMSMFVMCIDEFVLLTVIFPAQVSVGAVKYYALGTLSVIAQQLQVAQVRAPGEGFDLSVLNIANTADIFRKKQA